MGTWIPEMSLLYLIDYPTQWLTKRPRSDASNGLLVCLRPVSMIFLQSIISCSVISLFRRCVNYLLIIYAHVLETNVYRQIKYWSLYCQ